MSIKAFILGSALVSAFRQPAMSLGEIIPGVDKPSLTFARMLVAEMLQNLDAKVRRETYTAISSCSCDFPSMRISWYEKVPNGDPLPYEISSIKFNKGKFDNAIGADERLILLEGLKEFASLNKRREKLSAEERRQQLAIDAIESFFKKEPEPSPASPNATREWGPNPALSASVATTTSSARPAGLTCLVPVETS